MKRRIGLKRGTKRLTRSGPRRKVSKRSAHSKGHLFPKGVDERYRAFIRTFPCVIALRYQIGGTRDGETHFCAGHIECCHVRSRGAGGDDHQTVPLCALAHQEQHRIGIRSFEARYRVDLTREACRYLAYYEATDGQG